MSPSHKYKFTVITRKTLCDHFDSYVYGSSTLSSPLYTLAITYWYVYCLMVLATCLFMPHSRLFSLGANFPKFPEWTHNSGKFILGCCIQKFDYGLLSELGVTVIFSSINLLHPMQDSILSNKTISLHLQLLILKL